MARGRFGARAADTWVRGVSAAAQNLIIVGIVIFTMGTGGCEFDRPPPETANSAPIVIGSKITFVFDTEPTGKLINIVVTAFQPDGAVANYIDDADGIERPGPLILDPVRTPHQNNARFGPHVAGIAVHAIYLGKAGEKLKCWVLGPDGVLINGTYEESIVFDAGNGNGSAEVYCGPISRTV